MQGVRAFVMRLTSLLLVCGLQRIGSLELRSGFSWPDADLGSRSSEMVSAGKRASKYVGCMVCYMQLFQVLHQHANPVQDHEDAEVLDTWLKTTNELADIMENSQGLCKPEQLIHSLASARYSLKTNTDGTAELVTVEEGDIMAHWPSPTQAEDSSFNWKAFAVQHACLETFRKDGDKISAAAKEAWLTSEGQFTDEASESRAVLRRIEAVAHRSCMHGKMCRTQAAEVDLTQATQKRDESLAGSDSSYAPVPEDFTAKPVVKFDKMVDYYKVLGVGQSALAEEIVAATKKLSRLYDSPEGLELAGIDEEDGKSTMKEIKLAKKLLSDRATRRQYDQERDRMRIWQSYGLSERKPDRPHFEGEAALNAYADEFEELSQKDEL